MKKILAICLAFGMISISVNAADMLIPMGNTAGIKVLCDGTMVTGTSSIETKDGPRYPTKDAKISNGDVLKSINGIQVTSNEQLADEVNKIQSQTVDIIFERQGKMITSKITPALDLNDGNYKLGLWVRDSLAGIGTITYINPENMSYGALGHSIANSGEDMPIKQGELISSNVRAIKKSEVGSPGELQGEFNLSNEIGTVYQNEQSGIYGYVNDNISISTKPIAVAKTSEVQRGKAYILSNISGDTVKQYEIEILAVNNDDTKNYVLQVTDKELISKTGGIVQGMSGSPIIQNDKIIGAVTHVFVNEPTKGYGISIENMLSTAETID